MKFNAIIEEIKTFDLHYGEGATKKRDEIAKAILRDKKAKKNLKGKDKKSAAYAVATAQVTK